MAPVAEKRTDPSDGASYTFEEISEFYKGKYKKNVVQAYWNDECTAVKAKGKAKAKVKAKAKASTKEKTEKDAKTDGKKEPKKSKRVQELESKVAELEGRAKHANEFDNYLHADADRFIRKTLTQHILNTTDGDQQLTLLMNSIQHACKVCSNAIEKAGPAGFYGMADVVNATGDDVKKLDIIANDIWVECLQRSGVCALLLSEEDEEAIVISPAQGPFCVAFDPLDGSSNIDCNVSVGSIFSVYRRTSTDGDAVTADILKPGKDMIAAGYCMYGAATELILTYAAQPNVVERFALDPALGEFVYISNMSMDPKGGKKIFSCNEGNSLQWDAPILKSVEDFKENGYAARYVGSMVSDVHRTLLYGGIFLYPADKKSVKGKLRVLYEGFPMAMITEQAGGIASTGMFKGKVGRILEVMPEHIHDRCPIIMGAGRDVDQVLKLYE